MSNDYRHDICECGDYREDHEHNGPCRVCRGLHAKGLCKPGSKPCSRFKIDAKAGLHER